MWQPPGEWEPVPGAGPGTAGLWRVPGRRHVIVKRLVRPLSGDLSRGTPSESDPGAGGWWRREADVVLAGAAAHCPAFVGPEALDVVEDAEGISIFFTEATPAPVSQSEVARAVGALAASGAPELASGVRDQFGERLEALERRGGWHHLLGSPVAGVAEAAWDNRNAFRRMLEAMPRGPAHGDLTRANVLRPTPAGVLAVDWAMYGHAPLGSDLGHWSLAVGRDVADLLGEFLTGAGGELADGTPDEDGVLLTARTVALFTALARADWAADRLAREVGNNYGWQHPALHPHVRAVRRQGSVRALLGPVA